MFTTSFYLKFLKVLLPLFVVTLPLANRDVFSIFVSRLFPVRIILISLILVSGLYLVFDFFRSPERKTWLKNLFLEVKKDFVLKLLLVLLLVRVFSLVNSLNLSASFKLLLFYLGVISTYLILKFIAERQREFLGHLFRLHLLTVSLVALVGLLQLILAFFGLNLPGVLLGTTFVRIPATFYDANHLPAYLLTAFPTLLIYFFYAEKDFQKFSLAVLLSVFALVSLFTFSRSGYLSFFIAFLILGLTFLWRRYWQKVLATLAVLIFAFLVVFLSSQTELSIFKRLVSVFNLDEKSTVAHGLLIYGSGELLKQSPLVGLGYGSFSEHFRRSSWGRQHEVFDPATFVRIPAHSIWLEVLVETGFLGFALYLWLVITILEKGFQALRAVKDKRSYLTHLALLSSFVGLLVGGFFYSYNLEFFWFFVFFVYFQSRFLFASPPLAAREVDASEKVAWASIRHFLAVFALSSSLIFSGLSKIPILPGAEGFYATVGKDIRRDWGYRAEGWWLPKFEGQAVEEAPLPFWLNAFWTFLYDFGAGVPRFFPAFFGLLALLVFFLLSLELGGLSFAFFSTLFFLASPFFLESLRFGDVFGYVIFFSTAAFYLSKQVIERKKFFLAVPLIFLLSSFSLVSYRGYFLLLTILFLRFSYFSLIKGKVPFWLALSLWLSGAALLPWWSLSGFSLTDFSAVQSLKTVYFVVLPFLVVFAVQRLFGRYKVFLSLAFGFLIILSFYAAAQKTANDELTDLVQIRLNLNRDGRIPLYLLQRPLADVLYYSEVPVLPTSLLDLETKMASSEYFFAILEASLLRRIKESRPVSFRVAATRGRLALVEKPGQVD